jgi:hypothetical protein
VLRLRLGGAEFPDIREYAIAPEQAWDVSDSQLWRYIRAADQRCKEIFDAKADHLLARHCLQRRQLYAHALGAGAYGDALRCLQDEAKLEGIYPPTKIAPTTPDGDEPWNASDTEANAVIHAALARLGLETLVPPADGQADEPRPPVA